MKNENQQVCGRTGVTPASERLRRWELKYDADNVRRIIKAGKPGMARNARAAYERMAMHEQAFKDVLAFHAVPVSQVASYLCFVRELSKIDRMYSGLTRVAAAREKYVKWAGRQLDPVVLRAVADHVFSIPLPENPGDAVPTGEGA